jgi:hypothetical protein
MKLKRATIVVARVVIGAAVAAACISLTRSRCPHLGVCTELFDFPVPSSRHDNDRIERRFQSRAVACEAQQ